MNIETQAIDLEKALAPSLAKFRALDERVCGGDGLAMTHSKVADILWADGLIGNPPGIWRRSSGPCVRAASRMRPAGARACIRLMASSTCPPTSSCCRPEDIIDEMRRRKKAEKRPRPYKKRVWASVESDAEAVIRQAFEEAAIRDPGRKKTWVAHVDGNATQIDVLQRVAKEYGVEIIIVLDIIHALGYLWEAAHVFHKVGWVDERLLAVLEGRAGYVPAGMRQSATKGGLSKEKCKAADKCVGYLLNHKNFMRYNEYLAAGFPIASGVIEGVCRHLIKDRMDITGAR